MADETQETDSTQRLAASVFGAWFSIVDGTVGGGVRPEILALERGRPARRRSYGYILPPGDLLLDHRSYGDALETRLRFRVLPRNVQYIGIGFPCEDL